MGDDVTAWGDATNSISEISKNINQIFDNNYFQGQDSRQD